MNSNSLAFEWINLPDQSSSLIFHILPDLSTGGELFYLTTLSGWWLYNAENHTVTRLSLPADPGNLLGGINSAYPDKMDTGSLLLMVLAIMTSLKSG